MAVYNFPTSIRPAEVSWLLQGNTQTFESPLNRDPQTLELPGARWLATLRFDHFKRDEFAALETLITQLNGQAHRVLLWHHARENPRGSAPGTPLVNGTNQGGSSINTDGWTASQSNILLPGDHIGFGGELKTVTAATSSNASGQATIAFTPPIRNKPVDNAAITTVRATARFRLADNNQGRISSRRATNAVAVSFVEDLV